MEYTVIHDEKINRFEVFEMGQIAYLEYAEKDGVLDILHTFVPLPLEGQGIARVLTKEALDYAADRRMKVKATCTYAQKFFERNPQYRDLQVASLSA